MTIRFHHIAAASLAAMAAALVAQPAMAQSAPAAEAENTLGDIVVTARKVAESSQSLPITVAAFSGKELTNKAILDVRDLQAITPGLTVSNNLTGGVPIFSIRGVSTELGIEGGVALYSNDVPLMSSVGILNAFYDIASVEILKGPQGTQFGTNTTGGTISIRTNMPTDKFEGYVKAGYGNFNRTEFEGMINIPLDETTGIRLAGNYVKRDGYVKNLAAVPGIPDRFANENHYSLRGTVSTHKGSVRNDLIVDYYHRDEAPSGTIPVRFEAASNKVRLDSPKVSQRTGEFGVIYVGADPSGQVQPLFGYASLFGLEDRLTIDLSDNLTLRNVVGYRHDHTITSEDTSGMSIALVNTYKPTKASNVTDDITLRYTGVEGRLRAAIGGYFSHVDKDEGTNSNVFQALFLQNFSLPVAVSIHSLQNLKTTSKAAYFNAEYDITDSLGVSGGVRYNWDNLTSNVRAAQAAFVLPTFGDNFAVGGAFPCNLSVIGNYNLPNDTKDVANCKASRKASFRAPSWNFVVTNKFSSKVLAYAKISHGYLAGGANFTLREPSVAIFQPEKTTMIEAGLKADWELGGRPIRTNVAIYRGKTSNKQVFANANYDDGNGTIGAGYGVVNAAKQSVYGVDLELRYQPVDGLTFDVSYNYIHSKFDEFVFPAVGITPSRTLSGATPAQTPAHQLNLAASYVWPTSDTLGRITTTVSGYYTSSSLQFNGPSAFNMQFGPQWNVAPGYFIANATLNWENVAGSPVSAQLWVRNLADRHYVTSRNTQFETFGYSTATFGAPRTFGVSGTVRF